MVPLLPAFEREMHVSASAIYLQAEACGSPGKANLAPAEHWHSVLATSRSIEVAEQPLHTLQTLLCSPILLLSPSQEHSCACRLTLLQQDGQPFQRTSWSLFTLRTSAFMTFQLTAECVQPGRAAQLRHPALR